MNISRIVEISEELSVSPKLKWGAGLVLFLGLLVVSWLALNKRYDADVTPESYSFVERFEKEGIPAIQAVELDGSAFDLSKVKEPVVIINFWASWCNPCVEEFPSMLKLVESLKGQVAIVAVSMDDEEKDLLAFAKLFNVPRAGFLVAWDKDKKVMADYGVGKLPESYIVGPNRKLVRKVLGIENWASENAIAYFSELAKGAISEKSQTK
jgi:thiol-disulfide isomerase/thioredoxin